MVVIDASVINKLFLANEEGEAAAREIVQKHLIKLDQITVPGLLFYEVANTLITKTKIPNTNIIKSIKQLEKFNLLVSHADMNDLIKIAKFARQHKVTVYDASYAVLAQNNGCNLYTADSKFVGIVNLPFVKHLNDYQS